MGFFLFCTCILAFFAKRRSWNVHHGHAKVINVLLGQLSARRSMDSLDLDEQLIQDAKIRH